MKDFRRLLGYLWPHKWRIVLIVFLSAVVAVVSVGRLGPLGPMLSSFLKGEPPTELVKIGSAGPMADLAAVINRLTQPLLELARVDLVRFMLLVAAFLVVATFIRGVAAFFQEFLTATLSSRVTIDLANELYDRTLDLSLANYSRLGIADPVTRFTVDIDAISLGITTLLGKTIREPFTFLVAVVAMVAISPRLSLAVFAIVPLLAIIAAIIGKQVKRAMRNVLQVKSGQVRQLQQTFRGVRVVKAFVMEHVERGRFGKLNDRLYRQRRRIYASNAGVSPILELLGVLAGSVVLVLAAQAVEGGSLDAENLLPFVGALLLATEAIRKLSNVNNRIQMMLAAAGRVFELLDEVPTVREEPTAGRLAPLAEALCFEGVHFTYDGEEKVLRGVSLKARAGERIALVGPSGVGKTTLVNLIPRFYDPTAGRVTVDGVDLRDVTLKSLRAQIGLVTQDVLLFGDTVRANIAYGKPEATLEEIEEAARKAHADGFIRELPEGYDTLLGEEATTLSGGQRQRLALARAILKDPSIFILDEATSQLDSESERYIRDALEEFTRGRTTFIIAHRLSTVEHADRIVVMQEGRIADVGGHEELLARSELYRTLYRLQFAS